MVTDLFGSFLQDLGRIFELPDLRPDGNNSCLITLKNGVKVQLEMDRANEFLIVGIDIGVVPPGRYKENVFREALKANGLPPPLQGIFAYSTKTEHLVIFERFRGRELNADRISEFIQKLSEKALQWRSAIERGEIPTIEQTRSSSSGMFGLR